jgi:hypothetical protein
VAPAGLVSAVRSGHSPPPRVDPGLVARLGSAAGNRAVARWAAGPEPRLQRQEASAAPRLLLQRWDSPEHVQLGETAPGVAPPYIRLTAHGRDLPAGPGSSGWPPGWRAMRASPTSEQRRAMTLGLTYGEVIALSGDFYRTWDELDTASLREIIDLIPLIRGHATTDQLQEATAGRYLALASVNVSHFSNVPRGARSVDVWRDQHARAVAAALAGLTNAAWGINACADHFLTDAFSGGHIRTPRARLVTSTPGNIQSKILHDLDNTFGVDVANARGDTWTAYGDEQINIPANVDNLRLAKEAVQLSKQDVADALSGRIASVPATFAAEALVPAPVSPGTSRWGALDYQAMRASVIGREGPGIISGFVTDDDQVRDWVARQDARALARVPHDQKIRMIGVLMGGWIDESDLVAMETILASVDTEAEMELIRAALEPRAIDFTSFGQRTRFRIALARRVPAGVTP